MPSGVDKPSEDDRERIPVIVKSRLRDSRFSKIDLTDKSQMVSMHESNITSSLVKSNNKTRNQVSPQQKQMYRTQPHVLLPQQPLLNKNYNS